MSTFSILTIAGASLTCQLAFRKFEPQTGLSLSLLLLLVPGLLSVLLSPLFSSWFRCIFSSFTAYSILVLLFTLIYRLSPVHPLAQYPGPTFAKASKIWMAYVSSKGKEHLYHQSLHERYGDVVRVGPNELSFRDVSAIAPILGPGGLPKGSYWDNRSKPPAMVGLRDPIEHAQRRKAWNRAFAIEAIKNYEPFLASRIRQLIERFDDLIREQAAVGKDSAAFVDLSAWMTYFSTDFMGDMGFGGGFELMRDNGHSGLRRVYENSMSAAHVLGHIPWLLVFFKPLLGRKSPIVIMREFARANVTRRIAIGAERKDLFYYLVRHNPPVKNLFVQSICLQSGEDDKMVAPPPLPVLASDGFLAIVAGSDTTAITLTVFFYYMLRNPTAYRRLQTEVDVAFPNAEEPLDAAKLSSMDWLNACINEALRLLAPASTGSRRSVIRGAGPQRVGKYVVPEQTQVSVHVYSIQRDPRNFSSPDSFLPQRWLVDEGDRDPDIFVHNPAAFIPFSYGPANCAGKGLALLELRMLISWLVQRFEFRRHAGVDVDDWESRLKDYFVFTRAPLWLDIVSRG
ncbi:cytochrome P450 [Artomyces pyxidatus]|uniref:Cytochrome P450 n=1 Tax=Artomyces pyxidatus TaxID=48021 RepID=A0ACB8SLZ4_9AGAM|nr:cytochrome P450 [Artomyces pyxidatus]